MSSRSFAWSSATAVFGGAFDPPHVGHRVAVQGLFKNPGVRAVRVVPNGLPPFKSGGVTPAEHRLTMTQLTFEALDDVTIDDRELVWAGKSGTPSYSFHTLSEMRREFPNLAFVIGTDQWANLTTWHRFPELLSLSHWVVLARKPNGFETAEKTAADWAGSGLVKPISDREWSLTGTDRRLILCETDAPDLSSSTIRQRIALKGKALEGCLLPSVEAYLKTHRLYGSDALK